VQALALRNADFLDYIQGHSEEEVRELLLEMIDQDEENDSGLSPEDEAAIGRLQQLGFSVEQAMVALEVCDRNEEMAAEYLFTQRDQGMDSEEEFYG
jgi:hypothetical protein